jgi:hypothetical protein
MPSRVFAAAAAAAFLGLAGGALADEFNPTLIAAATSTQAAPPPRLVQTPEPRQTAAGRCSSLEQQFTAAALTHFAAKKLGAARKLAEEGTDDCSRMKYSLGTRRLVEALDDLGVTPRL